MLNNIDASFLFGQPCSIRNTAYLKVHKWIAPPGEINCVDVTGFKKNMHNKIRLSNYTNFFTKASNADTLYADHINITRFPILIVKSLPNLELIDLSGNKIRKLPTKMFRLAPKLKKLLVSDNKIMIPKRVSLMSSITLQTLMLSNNGIHTIYKYTFRKLPNLEVLYLDNNNLKTLNPMFGTLPNLKMLHVGRNYLTAIPPKELVSKSLRQFITKTQKKDIEKRSY